MTVAQAALARSMGPDHPPITPPIGRSRPSRIVPYEIGTIVFLVIPSTHPVIPKALRDLHLISWTIVPISYEQSTEAVDAPSFVVVGIWRRSCAEDAQS